MIKFEHVDIGNWEAAIRGMRNSWESWDKSDSRLLELPSRTADRGEFIMKFYHVGKEDLSLMMRLVKAGSDHAKFLRQILVSVDIIAPEYWWKEADTYKVGTVANSTSMMHKLGARELTADDFSFDDEDDIYVKHYLTFINSVREAWVKSGKKKPSPEWRRMNQLMSIAYLYRRTFTCNYAVLRSMYHSRKNHRLQEWHDFAAWCESLPYSELITYKGEK